MLITNTENVYRSHERRFNLPEESFRNESLARNPEENLLPVTDKLQDPSLSVCDQSNSNLENDLAGNSTNPTKVIFIPCFKFFFLIRIKFHLIIPYKFEKLKI